MKKTLLIISFMSLFSNFSLAQWLYSPTTIAICDYVDTKNINPDQMLLFYSKPEAAEEAAWIAREINMVSLDWCFPKTYLNNEIYLVKKNDFINLSNSEKLIKFENNTTSKIKLKRDFQIEILSRDLINENDHWNYIKINSWESFVYSTNRIYLNNSASEKERNDFLSSWSAKLKYELIINNNTWTLIPKTVTIQKAKDWVIKTHIYNFTNWKVINNANPILIEEMLYSDIVKLAHEKWYTAYDTMDWFMRYKTITREQSSKFISVFASNFQNTEIKPCSKFSDDYLFDSSLRSHIYNVCGYGLMKWNKWTFYAKNNISFIEAIMIMLRASQSSEEGKNLMNENMALSMIWELKKQPKFNFLQDYYANHNQAIKRWDLLKLLLIASLDK